MLEEANAYLNNRFMTFAEFDDFLDKMILENNLRGKIFIRFRLFHGEKEIYTFGTKGNVPKGNGIKREIVSDKLTDQFRVEVCIWRKTASEKMEAGKLIELFAAFWNRNHCDSSSGIVSTKHEDIRDKINDTIQLWKEQYATLAGICCSIDGAAMNTAIPDRAEMFCAIIPVLAKYGIVLDASEETKKTCTWVMFLKQVEELQLMDIVNHLRKELSRSIGKKSPHALRIGAYLVGTDEKVKYPELRSKMEDLYKNETINAYTSDILIRTSNGITEPVMRRHDPKLALVRVFNNARNRMLFHNIYLDYLADFTASYRIMGNEADVNNLRTGLEDIVKSFHFKCTDDVIPDMPTEDNEGSVFCRASVAAEERDSSAAVTNYETALAVLKGILTNPYSRNKKVVFEVSDDITICVDDVLVYVQSPDKGMRKFKWVCSKNVPLSADEAGKDTILIRSSTQKLYFPEDLFYKVITVDARPTVGGALPDFWASPMAELITAMQDSSNFSNIVLWGEFENVAEIHKLLIHMDQWRGYNHEKSDKGDFSVMYISRKTFQGYELVEKFRKKYKDSVFEVQDESHLLDVVYGKNNPMHRKGAKKQRHQAERVMNRKLQFDNMKLDITDGIRVSDLSEAFPTVLEIIRDKYRTDQTDEEHIEHMDRTGRSLYELRNFKILVLNPDSNRLPEYYYQDEEQLNAYYDEAFGKDNALFRRAMEQGNQLECAINYVTDSIEAHDFLARRGIIVIPNDHCGTEGYNPLGLVSVWIAPRKRGNTVSVDFSFTWRTVEALVGLPYSLYGSIRFAEELFDSIRMKVSEKRKGGEMALSMGKLTYMAYSLHMYLDPENENIAREIVNEASR